MDNTEPEEELSDSDKWYFAKFWTWKKIQLDRRRIDRFIQQYPHDWRAQYYRQVIAAHEPSMYTM